MDPPVRIVVIPSSDREFALDVERVAARLPPALEPAAAIERLRAALRHSYPTAVVREQDELAKTERDVRVWYVSRREHRSRIATAVTVALPPAVAYRTYLDRMVDWQVAVQLRPVILDPNVVGSEYEAAYSFLGRTFRGRLRIRAAVPPHSVAIEAEGSGISVWYVTTFVPEDHGTRVVVEGDYDLPEGIIPRVADRLVIERSIARDIDRANEAFRLLCETLAQAERR